MSRTDWDRCCFRCALVGALAWCSYVAAAAPVSERDDALRLEADQTRIGGTQRFRGRPYRVLSILQGKISTIQLSGDETGVARLNGSLQERLRTKLGEYYDCPALSPSELRARPGDYVSHARPLTWAGDILVLREDVLCPADRGEAYEYITWRVSSAEQVELVSWFNGRAFAKKSPTYSRRTPEFARVLAARWKASGRMCEELAESDSIREIVYTPLYPTMAGVAFRPEMPAANQGCAESFVVPYRQLERFLSDAGRSAVASIARTASQAARLRP